MLIFQCQCLRLYQHEDITNNVIEKYTKVEKCAIISYMIPNCSIVDTENIDTTEPVPTFFSTLTVVRFTILYLKD